MSSGHGTADGHIGLWLLVRRAAAEMDNHLSTAIAETLDNDDLSALTYAILTRTLEDPTRTLEDPTRTLCASQIATDLGLPSGSATRLIDRLTQAKLLDRRPSPTDRRVVYLVITPAGQALAAHLEPVVTAEINRWHQQLGGPRAVRQLQHLCRCLLAPSAPSTRTAAPTQPDQIRGPATNTARQVGRSPSTTFSRYPLIPDHTVDTHRDEDDDSGS